LYDSSQPLASNPAAHTKKPSEAMHKGEERTHVSLLFVKDRGS
jgi:hypothetical protein